MTNKPDAVTVHVLIYSHRHGVDVSSYETAQGAEDAVIEIIRENLDAEVPESDRPRIAAMLNSHDPKLIAEAIEAYTLVSQEHLDIYATTVQSAPPAPEIEPLKPMCPKCTTTDHEDIEIKETYSAYHPVLGVNSKNQVGVENALSMTSPSEHFDDGQGDYVAHCKSCLHEGTPQSFGLGDPADWEWL